MQVDLIFEGGTLLTMDPARPRATALAVHGGRIVAVGEGDELRRHLTAARVVSLQGRTVVPGFHDAHNHMPSFGMGLADIPLGSPPAGSVEDILRLVKARAATEPPGAWVIGSGYDQNKLAERRHPTAAELDAVAPDHRVWLRHNSGHMCVVGGRVLDAIGIDRVPVPEGGVVERDAAGRATGLLQEQAQALVRALVYPYPLAELVDAIGRASDHYLREGLTSVQEAGVGGGLVARSPVELAAWQEARRQGRLGVRATLMVAAEALHDLPHAAADGDGFGLDLGMRTGWGDDWLRIGAMKIFSDGSLIGRTAAMCCDFEDEAGNRGFFQMDVERLRRIITRAHRAGWQVATHAIGDRAVTTVLDIYEDALAAHPRADHRHRIEHCGVCRPDDVSRLARLGVIPVPQGRFINEIGDGMLDALGPARSRGATGSGAFWTPACWRPAARIARWCRARRSSASTPWSPSARRAAGRSTRRRRSPPRRPSAAIRCTPRGPPSARRTWDRWSLGSWPTSQCCRPILPGSTRRPSRASRCWRR
jgi:predicted amidohydrolase YtcJ